MNEEVERIMAELAEPFEEHEVKFKPAVVSGTRALALAYVDARCIQDRLDKVLGVANWQDEYEFLPDGSCVCRLRLRINGEWIQKMDVGGESEQPDEGDRRKAALSDSLKRAAVKFGIARYLYRAEQQWVDYDPQKKKFAKQPRLAVTASSKAPTKKLSEAKPTAAKPPASPPATTTDLLPRLNKLDKDGADKGWYRPGELVAAVLSLAEAEGWPGEIRLWDDVTIAKATEHAKAFYKQAKDRHEAQEKKKHETATA